MTSVSNELTALDEVALATLDGAAETEPEATGRTGTAKPVDAAKPELPKAGVEPGVLKAGTEVAGALPEGLPNAVEAGALPAGVLPNPLGAAEGAALPLCAAAAEEAPEVEPEVSAEPSPTVISADPEL